MLEKTKQEQHTMTVTVASQKSNSKTGLIKRTKTTDSDQSKNDTALRRLSQIYRQMDYSIPVIKQYNIWEK